MQNKEVVERIRQFFNTEYQNGKDLINYPANLDFKRYLKNHDIGVKLDSFKEIVLLEEVGLELGGIDKKSHSLVFPIKDLNLINSGNITLLGNEICNIKESAVDFCIFILIGINDIHNRDIEKLRQLSFISTGIEGFLIRSVPRRFWCRISSNVINKEFSFEFLGNAIQYLYYSKFGNLVKSIEIFIISSYPDSIDMFTEISSEIRNKIRQKLKIKIDEWKKNIDCDYDWGCEICPYKEECYNVKELLIERERLSDS